MKRILLISFLGLCFAPLSAQSSRFLATLVDSLPGDKPVLVQLPVDSGFMAVERVALSKNGRTLYYGVRNGYDSTSIAQIRSLSFRKKQWQASEIVFGDSSGAPALSADNRTMYFQYDHPVSPQGLYSLKSGKAWATPLPFIDSLKKSHYLQSPRENVFYYSASLDGKEKRQDIFRGEINERDTTIKRMGYQLNGDFADFFVARDESFVILIISQAKNKDAYFFHGKLDLFISFKTAENAWTRPLNLGKHINGLSEWTWGPYVT
ncbi:MAG: hypothetical protein AAFV07_07365, partial [Bacteroidota bacterium]